MYDKDSKGISYSAGFFMLIAFCVAGVILSVFIGAYVWQAMTGTSALKMSELVNNPAYSGAAKTVQCIAFVGGFLLPAILTAMLLNRKPMKLVGLSYSVNWKQIGLVIAIMLAALWAGGFLSFITDQLPLPDSWRQQFDKMENNYQEEAQAMLIMNNTGDYLFSIFVMAFLPGLCEELVFRGGLQNYLFRWTNKPWLSIIIVSIIFSAVHFSFYGFLTRTFLGIVLGLMYHYSGRLWLSVAAHFINNAIIVTIAYVAQMQGHPIPQAMAEKNYTWIGVFAIPLVIALLVIFKKIANKPKEEDDGRLRNEELRNTPFY